MKQPRGRQEPRRMGNAAMVVTMLVSLCVLTYIKARYCSNPFRTSSLSLSFLAPSIEHEQSVAA
jgi:hypothetical protein